MKRAHKLCIAFAVLLIAIASFISTASAAETEAEAEVSRIQTNKGHVYINAGKDAGFVVGADVCFYAASGEEIACGVVKQTNPNYAMIKVDNREAKKIKVGMKAFIGQPNPETDVKAK